MAWYDRLPFVGNPDAKPDDTANDPVDQTLGHTIPAPDPGSIQPRVGTPPIGGTGRANFYGLPQFDELNQKLSGAQGLRIFDDMYWTDAHVRRLVLAAWSPIVAGTWTLEPYGGEDATDQDRQIAEQIEWMLNEWMSPNLTEHLLELGPSLLRFGFTPFEQQWDTCQYQGKGPALLGPRKLGYKLPRTIWKWWQDDFGNLTHIGQILPNKSNVTYPASELVYYQLAREGDNWMGRSLLRHAYKHWYLKDKLERIDAIGQERKAVGVPIVYMSPDIPAKTRQELERAIANLHVSEVAYLQIPGWKMGEAPEGEGNQFLVDIVQFDSSSGSDIKESIDYHQQAISSSFLTDFLELGHHQVGARATADVQEDPFLTAITGALLPFVVPPLDKLVDRIRKLNWENAEGSPHLRLTLHDEASLSEIAAYLQTLITAELIQVDPDLEDWARDRASLPPANAEYRDKRQLQMEAEQQAKVAQAQATAADPTGEKAAAAAAKANGGANPAKSQPKSQPPSSKRTLDQPGGPIAAGLIVQAADSGRVLMIQRTDDHADDDDTRARWEFGGGKLEDGETTWDGGLREWQEETGATLPATAKRAGQFVSPDGKYQAFAVRVPSEADITLGKHDPDEVAAVRWWQPAALATDHRVRGKVQEALPDITRLLKPASDAARQLDVGWDGALTLLDAYDPMRSDDPADRRVVCDFDGVIHDKQTGELVRDPVTHTTAVDVLPRLAVEFEVVICTANPDLNMVREWLRAHDLGQFADTVTNLKPPATAYIDDNGIEFKTWGRIPEEIVQQVRRGRNPVQPKQLDAPLAPPNLRGSADVSVRCGTCKMFDPSRRVCWSYEDQDGEDYPVTPYELCDSWALSPTGQKVLDGEPDGANPKTPAAAGVQLDAESAPEPTANWWERLLSQDRLREALDGARDHVQAAVGPAATLAAQQMANQAANSGLPDNPEPPAELVDAFTRHYEHLYALGRETVTLELQKQRRALGKQLDDPADTSGGLAGQRLGRARQRGEHSARNVIGKIREVVGRAQISGLRTDVQTAAEQASAGQIRIEALNNTSAMINDGRADSAAAASDVIGAYYTSVMDDRSCDNCVRADDGRLLTPDEAVALGPPNPLCDGRDFCRCALMWVLSNDPAALAAVEG